MTKPNVLRDKARALTEASWVHFKPTASDAIPHRMVAYHPIVQGLVEDLTRNAEASLRLRSEREFLEKSLADARKHFSAPPRSGPDSRQLTADVGATTRTAPNGPLETLLTIVERYPGIDPSNARRQARATVVTLAKDKARSIEESLRRAIADRVITLRNGGLYKGTRTTT